MYLGTNVFHIAFLIQNGPPKGPPALYLHNSEGTCNQMCYLGTKLFHIAFLIQNGPPKYHHLFTLIKQRGPQTEVLHCYNVLSTKSFHITFLNQNVPPKRPPAPFFHNSNWTSNCFIWAPNYYIVPS